MAEKAQSERGGGGRRALYYTFGNHMHWVDMQWLWGYHVLPASVRDMLHLVRETGARGGVNFDAVGYEKLAAESPEALAELREAVAAGLVEPVGGSYGQPYGLFQPLESNIRQFTYGVRATQRLLGVRPRTFWEEEFYFFPKLPQVLRQCGYTGACLFFQWTWHTPEVPREAESLIVWEGADGTGILTLPRNELNVHQWPEDFDGLLEGPAAPEREAAWGAPAIVQWLELMPSRDWMCRSEVLLPRLKELMGDGRFEVRARTPGALIQELAEAAQDAGGARAHGRTGGTPVPPVSVPPASLPRRRYTMDEVWHGMTLGKNADRHPRACAEAERAIREAECASATASLLGRPYASWDVYPTWELDEAWRNLLAGQHHDNHECEGLCGFIGHGQVATALQLAEEVMGRVSWLLGERTGEDLLQFNSAGWARTIHRDLGGMKYEEAVATPAFGYAVRQPREEEPARPRVARRGGRYRITGERIEVEVDAASGAIVRLSQDGAEALGPEARLFTFAVAGKKSAAGPAPEIEVIDKERLYIKHDLGELGHIVTLIAIAPSGDAVDLNVHHGEIDGDRLEPGFGGAALAEVRPGFAPDLHAATAGEISVVRPSGRYRRKYPSGDWMTAPQWFEDVVNPFCALGLVDLVNCETGSGLLVLHEGCQQWLLQDEGPAVVVTARDPWDEGRYDVGEYYFKQFRLALHAALTDAERARISKEFLADCRPNVHRANWSARPVGGGTGEGVEVDAPPVFGPLSVEGAPGVLAEAFYRESMYSGERLAEWAGHRMFAESAGACDHPFVVRLVEYNGEGAEVTLKLAGDVAMAAKTNLMGEVPGGRGYDAQAAGAAGASGTAGAGGGWSEADCGWLAVERDVAPPAWAVIDGKPIEINGAPLRWSQVRFRMRPREIATVMCDMVMGRKQWRDLDAKREVWATVHKTPGSAAGEGNGGAAESAGGGGDGAGDRAKDSAP
jgi:alpha-mannosidase